MARPQTVQELRHGKILSGKVFPNFVESWNYLKNRVESLRGDADIVSQYGQGHIKVDNTDPEHPVIRCVNLPEGGGGGGGEGGHSTCGAFSYDEDTHTIKDGLYLRARQWTAVADAVVTAAGYAYLKIGMGTSGTAEVVTGQSSIPTTDRYYMYIPLYIFDANLKVTNDYRGAPTAQIWEYE